MLTQNFLKFNNIWIELCYANRKSVNEWYWPYGDAGYPHERTALKNKGEWYKGWKCEFSNNGCSLTINSAHTEVQCNTVRKYREDRNIKINPSLITITNQSEFIFELESDFLFTHPLHIMERIREEVDVAGRLDEHATDMYTWQFITNNDEKTCEYGIKFNREITEDDLKFIADVSAIEGLIRIK